MTNLKISVDYTLQELRAKYRQFHGYDKKHKITKEEIGIWLGGLAEADIQDLDGYDAAEGGE
jgi:hypothetical protein